MKLPFEKIQREVIIKVDEPGLFGINPIDRSVKESIDYAIVNIDKPKGPTSHQISEFTKNILNINKAGHSGTLDPGVTGCLPVTLGKATRIVEVLLTAGKEYVGVMHLHNEVSEAKLRDTVNHFIGKITQLPPVKSAVKRQERVRKVYYFEILEIDGQDVLFRSGVQAGTYIRKLCHDIGLELGGAHMAELRRTKAGPFNDKNLVTLQDLADAYHYYQQGNEEKLKKILLPMESAIEHIPKIWVRDSAINSLCHGANVNLPGISKFHSGISKGEIVAVMTLKGELIGYGKAVLSSKEMLGEKGLAVNISKVFMQP